MYFWYKFLTYLFYPFAPIYLFLRKIKKREHSIRYKEKLSQINIPLEPVVRHALDHIAKPHDYGFFMLMSIETPFKKSQIIESGINIMNIFEVDTVVGVRPERSLLLNHNGKGMQFFMKQGEFRLERNDSDWKKEF